MADNYLSLANIVHNHHICKFLTIFYNFEVKPIIFYQNDKKIPENI